MRAGLEIAGDIGQQSVTQGAVGRERTPGEGEEMMQAFEPASCPGQRQSGHAEIPCRDREEGGGAIVFEQAIPVGPIERAYRELIQGLKVGHLQFANTLVIADAGMGRRRSGFFP